MLIQITTETVSFFYQEDEKFSDTKDAFEPSSETIIGNDVWIAAEAMIRNGVTVGDGAIITSRVVVTKDVVCYSMF